jgi:hypothetical protein
MIGSFSHLDLQCLSAGKMCWKCDLAGLPIIKWRLSFVLLKNAAQKKKSWKRISTVVL